MGGAASSKYSLSDSDKKEVVLKLQTLHETLKADSSNEAEVYNKLSKAFEEESKALIENRVVETVKTEALSGDFIAPYTSEMDDTYEVDAHIDDVDQQINTQFSNMSRVRTSSELLNDLSTKLSHSTDQMAVYMDKFKFSNDGTGLLTDKYMDKLKGSNDVGVSDKSGFRARRLTAAQKTAEDESVKPPMYYARRTTIYSSTEMGVTQEKITPFPTDILGTFSCHGIEPSDVTIDGVKQKINQDRGCVAYPFNSCSTDALFLVLDGHGEQGDRVSEFVMRQLVISLEKHPKMTTDPIDVLKETFVLTHTALTVTPIKYMTSGCTCVAVYCQGRKLYIANCGDSRAVMATEIVKDDGSTCLIAQNLSQDHKPDSPDEMARINQWGGFVSVSVEEGVTSRVWLDADHTLIGLAMSRSIGDEAVKSVGVIPEPEVTTHELSHKDKFMIMASDGVWEFIDSQEAVDIVQQNIHLGAYEACQVLIKCAADRWEEEEGDYRDDITAIVMRFPIPFTELPLISSTSSRMDDVLPVAE